MILNILEARFNDILEKYVPGEVDSYIGMISRCADARYGDYQANFSMPLGKRLGKNPRELACVLSEEIRDACAADGLLEKVEVAGPGFLNFTISESWMLNHLQEAVTNSRLGVKPVSSPRKYVVDYSSPNVAKPMHVGHIRSTVIGDSICRMLRFLGHHVISDNHLGDWGTQFGMIIYGWKHFRDEEAYHRAPILELTRLYKLVRKITDYHATLKKIPLLQEKVCQQKMELASVSAQMASGEVAGDSEEQRKIRKKIQSQQNAVRAKLKDVEEDFRKAQETVESVQLCPEELTLYIQHEDIADAARHETERLHAGDSENRALWEKFMPVCLEEISRVYERLNITFTETLGESFYNEMLPGIVSDLQARGLARESDGALCVFLEGQDSPMLVRKRDGAYLYATTDLATIQYRMETYHPDAILYVVDDRQSEHFIKLFMTARMLGYTDVELRHISFGTVQGEDHRPYKTRSGDTVGLEGLLDEAVARAAVIIAENDPNGVISESDRVQTAARVGIAALKYADLSQNRESDYVFSYDKMLAMTGNTATYMQYAYARARSIFIRGGFQAEKLRTSGAEIMFSTPEERALGLELLRFEESLYSCVKDYRPNFLTGYLYELANRYSAFFEKCPVLKSETEKQRDSRLLLCDLTARTLAQGLELLGISVVEKM